MIKDLKYLAAFTIPLSGYIALKYLGIWSWATVFLGFIIIPILDAIIPPNKNNISPENELNYSNKFFFDFLLYICAPICYLLVFMYLSIIKTNQLSISETLGLTLSIGIVLGTIGINVSHELGHRTNPLSIFLAKMGLLITCYLHFFIEHNRGHHKNVATPQDAASAKINEPIYFFFFRSIVGQYFNAWNLERERLSKSNKSIWNIENQMIQFGILQILYFLGIAYFFGLQMIPYALIIAFIAILLLEAINYIEHYGLSRNILPSGIPERVLPKHSWNSNHEIGRIILFELTRHSDHHYKTTRKYQILRTIDESPQLPIGYPGSLLLAFIPFLWFKIMNKRISTH